MNASIFEKQYKKLNPEQRKAVDAIDGPVIVIAGPGTGKTSILTLRIANILRKTDTAPENILALTFTESGVHSIRKKLVEIIGATGYRVRIHTFHSFCNEVIKNFPQEFPRIIGAQHVTDLDQIGILEELILDPKAKLESLRPAGNPLFYLKSVLGFIKELKREDVGPEEFVKHVDRFEKALMNLDDLRHEKGAYKGEIKAKYKPAQRKIENSHEFAGLYEKYQAALEERRLYDYEDMIVEVLRELRENQNLLLELQETHQYILADEHQDANRGQNRLLELLSGFHAPQPNLFVVGDEKQAIFRFQGASLENFLYFKKHFPDAQVIQLSKNYRSIQQILDASHGLIQNNPTGEIERVRLEAHGEVQKAEKGTKNKIELGGPHIFVHECETPQAEATYVAKKIAEKIFGGVDPEQITVLFRDNRDADLIARSLDGENVKYVVHTDVNVIGHEYIQKLMLVLRAVNNFGENTLLAPILFLDLFHLDHLDVFKILDFSRKERWSIADILRSKNTLEKAGVEAENIQNFTDFYKNLHELSVVAKNKGLIDSLQEIVSRTGFIGFILAKPRALELVAAYDGLLSHTVELLERHKDVKLADYLNLLDKMSVHNVSVRAKGFAAAPGRVNLMTAHKSKGLEFDHIFCVHLNEGKWGGRRNSAYFLPPPGQVESQPTENLENDIADERRLLYVALTRARKEIFLTCATRNVSGREILPSQFIAEIDPALVSVTKDQTDRVASLATSAKQAADSRAGNGGASISPELDIKNREYLAKNFAEHGFSVSALNNYLTCPWRFFFLNMIRIPRAEERFQLYGTAVHETLRLFFDSYREDKVLTKAHFLDFFEKFLNRKALSSGDYELFLDKGRKSLGGYYDTYKGSWPKNILNEYNISGAFIPLKEGEIAGQKTVLIRGQLDKVEFLENGHVNVVDYKTGNPKSRREIEGETKDGDGNYKRQLIFYKLLLERHDPDKFHMDSGEIDFVEPNKQGKYKREKFSVTDEEVAALVTVIKKAAKEILDLAFWDKTCDDPECEHCAMRKLLGLNESIVVSDPSFEKAVGARAVITSEK